MVNDLNVGHRYLDVKDLHQQSYERITNARTLSKSLPRYFVRLKE